MAAHLPRVDDQRAAEIREAARVQPSPVVNLAGAQPPREAKTSCGRCGGGNASHMTFCQFCGAKLEGAAPPPPMAAPPAERPRVPTAPESPGAIVRPEPARPQVQRPVAPGPSARLVVIAQDGSRGRDYPVGGDQTDIGREEGSILLPNDPYVSARHARITRRGSAFAIKDLASANGVFVRIRAAVRLQHADLILIGLEVLRFEAVSDAEMGLGPATERGVQVFGSPAAARYARLCQRTVEGVARDVYYLSRDETILGRESGDIVFTNDPFMSRRHAALERDPVDNSFRLRDLGSSNGSYVAIRGEHALEPGDHVRIGQHLFRLDVDPRA